MILILVEFVPEQEINRIGLTENRPIFAKKRHFALKVDLAIFPAKSLSLNFS